MRFLKLTSNVNPETDYIDLNDTNNFFCTSFTQKGLARKLSFLEIDNYNINVGNKTNFKKYSLTVEILKPYSEYEKAYDIFSKFLQRNKKTGVRVYYRPFENLETHYCVMDIENLQQYSKKQPIVLNLIQKTLWLNETKISNTQAIEQLGNLTCYKNDDNYYSIKFLDDNNYYCVSFYNGVQTKTEFKNNSYNEIPVQAKIYGPCNNPLIKIYKKGENEIFKQTQIFITLNNDTDYIFINSKVEENGVYKVNQLGKTDLTEVVNNEYGSPYIYIPNGEFYAIVEDDGGNVCVTEFSYNEEFDE